MCSVVEVAVIVTSGIVLNLGAREVFVVRGPFPNAVVVGHEAYR